MGSFLKRVNWNVTMFLMLVHALALGGLYFFSWEGFALFCLLSTVSGLGVTVGYHRYFTHGGFHTWKPIRWLLAIAGMFSGEGSAIFWVAFHRKHHQCSDKEGDPHSPTRDGFLWAHMLWLMAWWPPESLNALFRRYAKDLVQDRFLLFLHKKYPLWHAGFLVLLVVSGYIYGGLWYAASFAAYGFFARMAFVLHSTWCVNSLSHMFGYTNYDAGDDSRNNWFVALLTFGEGWHNNHHAHPTLAVHGHRWWEVDPSYWVIRAMQALGLAWDVKGQIPSDSLR